MEKKFDLMCLGEILLRLSPQNHERIVRGETFVKQVGGAELNVASGVSLLGLRTGILSQVPDNAVGGYVKNGIRFCGVCDEYLAVDSEPDGRLGIYYYEDGAYPRKPSVVYDREHTSFRKLTAEDVPETLFGQVRCFHTSGITLALSRQCRETAVTLMKRFREAGALISFDVNYRANLWSGEEARAAVEEILPLVDIFFCSESTARLTFLKEGAVRGVMREFADQYGISVVATTSRVVHSPKRHTMSSVIYDARNQQYYEEKPYENIDVVDRIGSGDAYVGGVLYGLLSEGGGC